LPFKFSPPSAIASLLGFCEGYDVSAPNGVSVDLLISLQFPAYGLTHPRHRLWLMHQHRAAYELYDEATATAAERELAVTVRAFDDRVLPMIGTRFANSRRVAERLAQFTGLSSTPLYHPPFQAERFFCAPAADYVFFPSRLETLKRQDLLIEAARHVATPVKFLLAGDGGQWSRYQSLIDSYQLGERVRLLGRITEAEKRVFYANALAVFYGPRDEDYGYVTLEAMLATCRLTVAPLRYGAAHPETDLEHQNRDCQACAGSHRERLGLRRCHEVARPGEPGPLAWAPGYAAGRADQGEAATQRRHYATPTRDGLHRRSGIHGRAAAARQRVAAGWRSARRSAMRSWRGH